MVDDSGRRVCPFEQVGSGAGEHRRNPVLPAQTNVNGEVVGTGEQRAHVRVDVRRPDSELQRPLDLRPALDFYLFWRGVGGDVLHPAPQENLAVD